MPITAWPSPVTRSGNWPQLWPRSLERAAAEGMSRRTPPVGSGRRRRISAYPRIGVSGACGSDCHRVPAYPRGRTLAQSKREGLQRLWDHDTRVAPWRGTAFGALQAVNTFTHHEGTVRGMARSERNMLRATTGATDALDRRVVDTILRIAA